jgi:hypothetical protein
MKGYRTLLLNGAIVVIPVVAESVSFLNGFDWRSILPKESAGWVIIGIGLLNIWLRFITNTGVGKKR